MPSSRFAAARLGLRLPLRIVAGGLAPALLLLLAGGCSGGSGLDGNGEEMATESRATLGSAKLRLKTVVTGNYLMAQQGGGSGLDATSTNASTWETFTVADQSHATLTSGDQVALAALNGQYIAAENGGGGVLNANRAVASTWETFVLAKASGSGAIKNGDVITLQTSLTKQYLSANNGGGSTVTADRAVPQAWEQFVVELVDGTTAPPTPPTTDPPPPPSTPGVTDYAPYFFTWTWSPGSSNDFASLMNLKNRAGLTGATIAFVLSNGGCATDRGVQDNLSDVKAFVAAGGKIKASFGGASGKYIENGCGDASSLAAAIEGFVDETGIKDLDFDVEQDAAFTDAVNQRRATALKKVQDERGVKVSFTLAANPSYNGSGGGGLTGQGMTMLRVLLSKGVAISHVNMMVMDYGDDWASKNMGQIAIGSITDAHNQLKTLIPGLTDAQSWAMIGATPMIGRNDDAETFTLANARDLTAFAKANKIGLVAFWAINRDTACGDYNNCALASQNKYDFHNILKGVQ